MIDKKKIEEAARNQFVELRNTRAHACMQAGFKAGVTWAISEFLKGLWHDASEVPKDKREIIFEYKESDTLVGGYNNTKWFRAMIWKSFADTWDITRWCYIDDLLPKKGGEYGE